MNKTITNAHTHLELGWLSYYCPSAEGTDFTKWLNGLILERRKLGKHWLSFCKNSIIEGILQLKSYGITDVADVTSWRGLSIKPLVESKLNAIVYIEIKGGGAESSIKLKRVKKAILQAKRLESSTFRVGLSIHSIYSTHPLIWEQMLNFAFAEQLPVCIHAAESPAEREFALCGSGTLKTEYLSRYEDLHIPTPYLSPIRYLEKLGALEFKPLLIHCVEVDENDIKLISRSGCRVVHCPRSNALLNCNLMPLHSFFAAQVPVFLGTDSLASSPNLNVLEEAAVAISSHKNKVNEEAIMSLTSKSIFSVV